MSYRLSSGVDQPSNKKSSNLSAQQGLDGLAYKILVVDDESRARKLLRLMLEEHFTVLEAENVDHAEKVIATEEVHLVLSDYKMPRRTGIDLVKSVNKGEKVLPIILMTGHGLSDLDAAVHGFQIAGMISKPFDEKRSTQL